MKVHRPVSQGQGVILQKVQLRSFLGVFFSTCINLMGFKKNLTNCNQRFSERAAKDSFHEFDERFVIFLEKELHA